MPRKSKKVTEEEEIHQENEDVEVVILQKRTRYGRKVKKPVRYEPVEKVEDDYSDSEISENDESESICSETGSGSEYEDSIDGDDSDADEHGNLKDFVTYSEDESEEEEELLEDSEDEYITSEDEESEDEENK